MQEFREFLELSTIHGLYYVSLTNKADKCFWILIVLAGFCVAGFMIYESFHNWSESPIKTTIETLPISGVTFPNVTVCPPKNSLLNLITKPEQSSWILC